MQNTSVTATEKYFRIVQTPNMAAARGFMSDVSRQIAAMVQGKELTSMASHPMREQEVGQRWHNLLRRVPTQWIFRTQHRRDTSMDFVQYFYLASSFPDMEYDMFIDEMESLEVLIVPRINADYCMCPNLWVAARSDQ